MALHKQQHSESVAFKSPGLLLQAASVAIVGASENGPWPKAIYESLNKAQFGGKVYLINPRQSELWGQPCYADFSKLPAPVDAAVVLVRASLVAQVLEDGAQHGLGAAVVFSSSLGEGEEPESPQRGRALAELARHHDLRICGPNCLGLVAVRERLVLFPQPAFSALKPGAIGAVFQSGGILQFWLSAMAARGAGFSYAVSSGNEIDLDLSDYVNFLVDDEATRVIALFVEGIRRPEMFRHVAERALAAGKPIIVVKTGRSARSRASALSHTGALAGDDELFGVFCRAYGLIRCDDLDEALEVTLAFQAGRIPSGPRVGIVVNSGGLKNLVLDEADANRISLPQIDPATIAAVQPRLTPDLKIENPLDCSASGALDGTNFAEICIAFARDPNVDLLGVHGVLPHSDKKTKSSAEVYRMIASETTKPVLVFSRMAHSVTDSSLTYQQEAGLPFLQGVPHAVRALGALVSYAAAKHKGVPRIAARSSHRNMAGINDLKTILSTYGICFPSEGKAATPREAATLAETIGFPVALKVVSPDIGHKTEFGGVRLNLAGTGDVEFAARHITDEIARHAPLARIEGFLVQEMIEGAEIIVGLRTDPLCGPMILVGAGGILVELIEDKAFRLLPIGPQDARDMIAELRVSKLLASFRGRPPCDTVALVHAICGLSDFYLDHLLHLVDFEINPLIVLPRGQGVRAVDVKPLFVKDARQSVESLAD